jgi:hypothetical protein
MYDPSDPRRVLMAEQKTAFPARPAGYGLFYRDRPVCDDDNGRTWLARGQNLVVAYSELQPGASFERADQIDEFVVLLPYPETPVVANARGQVEHSDGYALIIMPPGPSRLVFPRGGRVVRLFSTRSADLVAKCSNADDYREPDPNRPPFEPWPDPVGGYRIRVHSLDVPPQEGRAGKIFRCTTMMVNASGVRLGPRDSTKLSPHAHDDFEQYSLALSGTWTHHMRWPWTTDLSEWREDVHAVVESPSLTVIPPRVIHTSVYGDGENQLVDIFAPPRKDFSRRPGWVLNADDYPMPMESA